VSWADEAARYDLKAALMEPTFRPVTSAMLDAAGVGPGTRLLDLACGPGHTTAAAQARGADALSMDVTPAMVEAARRRFPGVRFAVGDMLQPPAGPWHAITCRFGAHHADPSWLRAAWRVLAPGGRLAIAETAPTDEASRRSGMQPPEHWVRLLEEADFADVTVQGLGIGDGANGHGHHSIGTVHVISGRRPEHEGNGSLQA
jgi:ubiquinone/menaquinone biosynthesis C-methylase UbiE